MIGNELMSGWSHSEYYAIANDTIARGHNTKIRQNLMQNLELLKLKIYLSRSLNLPNLYAYSSEPVPVWRYVCSSPVH